MRLRERACIWSRVIPGVWVAVLFLAAGLLHADPAADYWRKGEELYETHHLAPDRFAQALKWYEKAVALRKKDYEFLWKLSKRYQIYGQVLGKDRKKEQLRAWKKGLKYGQRAIRVNPDGKEGHFYYMANMGAIAQRKGLLTSLWRFRKIKRQMAKTLALAPDWPPILLARARLLMELPGVFGGDKEEAMRLCQQALELDPDYLPTYVAMARLLAEQGRCREALVALNQVLRCKNPRQLANYLKVDRPRAEAVLEEIQREACGIR